MINWYQPCYGLLGGSAIKLDCSLAWRIWNLKILEKYYFWVTILHATYSCFQLLKFKIKKYSNNIVGSYLQVVTIRGKNTFHDDGRNELLVAIKTSWYHTNSIKSESNEVIFSTLNGPVEGKYHRSNLLPRKIWAYICTQIIND